MHSSKFFEEVSKKSNHNGFKVNKESNKSHQKFDFGRCKVCKDKATGIHYGIPSCEGCKVIMKNEMFQLKMVLKDSILI